MIHMVPLQKETDAPGNDRNIRGGMRPGGSGRALSIYKFSVTLEGLIQQSVSKITMSLQNDLDTVNEKGVALSRIYDLNSWLMENYRDIPFIDNLIYDRNYRITAVISRITSTKGHGATPGQWC